MADKAPKEVGVKIHSQKSSKAAGQLTCNKYTLREEFDCPAALVFETLMDEQASLGGEVLAKCCGLDGCSCCVVWLLML